MFAFSLWPHGALLATGVVVGLLWLVLQVRADHQRTARFATRDAPAFDVWFEQHYGPSAGDLDKRTIHAILDTFGEAFGVSPTRLQPEDRLEVELRLNGNLSLDDVWETLDALLASRFGRSFQWSKKWRSVDDVIRGLAEQMPSQIT